MKASRRVGYRLAKVFLVAVLAIGSVGASACASSHPRSSSSSASSSQSSKSGSAENLSSKSDSSSASSSSTLAVPPPYADSRWPTNDPELLGIPESNRYYAAGSYVGEIHTVAGPVVNVYQATQSRGMPIFVNIGAKYPSSECFTLLIWAEDLNGDIEEMLDAVDQGNAWIEVTGYVSLYEGRAQIQTGDGPIEFTWWANVG